MRSFNFTIIASGLDHEAQGFDDRFFEAGCNDATLSIQKGHIVLEFQREASSFIAALVSAVGDVERAGATVERVEPDDLVNASDIARRSGLGRAAVSLYVAGARRQGFPPPVARVTTDSPLWNWVDVASWMFRTGRLPRSAVVHARIVRDVNRTLSDRAEPRSRFSRRVLKPGLSSPHAA